MVPTFGSETFADCENPTGERAHMKSALEATTAIRVRILMSDNVMDHLTAERREVAKFSGAPPLMMNWPASKFLIDG